MWGILAVATIICMLCYIGRRALRKEKQSSIKEQAKELEAVTTDFEWHPDTAL